MRLRSLLPVVAFMLLGFLAIIWLRRPLVVRTPLHTLSITGDVHSAKFSPDGRSLIIASSDGDATVLDVAAWQEQRHLVGAGDWIYFPKHSRDIITFSRDSVHQWDCTTWKVRQMLKTSNYPSAVSPDSGTAVVPLVKTSGVHLLDLKTGQVEKTVMLPGASGNLIAASYSPDGKTLVLGSDQGIVTVWNVSPWHLVRTLHEPDQGIEPVAFSPDGRTLAVGGGAKTVRLLDAATGQKLHSLSIAATTPSRLIFSPDSKRLLTAGYDDVQTSHGRQWQSNTLVKLWNTETGQEIASLSNVDSDLRIEFSHDGKQFVTGGFGLALWDTASGRELCSLGDESDSRGPNLALAFSPDDTLLATGAVYGSVKVWRLPN